MNNTTLLAISGSLKRRSVNGAALRAAAAAGARDGVSVTIPGSVRELPHFDPDLEPDPPEAVLRFRAACEAADGFLFCVPEYAFGIPGSFKNALDWTVCSTALYRKPVSVLSVAPAGRGTRVRHALDLVLTALGTEIVHRSVPVASGDRDEDGEIVNSRTLNELRYVVAELAMRVRLRPHLLRSAMPQLYERTA
jgi:NAD(P)H-dependent FMN reductase